MLTAYLNAVMHAAHHELIEGDTAFYAEIPGFQGVYANAATLEACRAPPPRTGARIAIRAPLRRAACERSRANHDCSLLAQARASTRRVPSVVREAGKIK